MSEIEEQLPDYGSWLPEKSKEDIDVEIKAKQHLEASVPVIKDVIDWFDKQLTTYKNPLTIEGVNPSTDAETVKQAVLFAQLMISDYKRQKDQFAAQFSEYIMEVDEQ